MRIETDKHLDAITAYVYLAWTGDDAPKKTYRGEPRTVAVALPFVSIIPEAVQSGFDQELGTLADVGQTNAFTIIGRFPIPSDPDVAIPDEQTRLANLLIGQLQSRPDFYLPAYGENPEVALGNLPLVSTVDFSSYDLKEGYFDVTLSFSFISESPHSD
jgi:hypothetical protein